MDLANGHSGSIQILNKDAIEDCKVRTQSYTISLHLQHFTSGSPDLVGVVQKFTAFDLDEYVAGAGVWL